MLLKSTDKFPSYQEADVEDVRLQYEVNEVFNSRIILTDLLSTQRRSTNKPDHPYALLKLFKDPQFRIKLNKLKIDNLFSMRNIRIRVRRNKRVWEFEVIYPSTDPLQATARTMVLLD